MSKKHTNSVEAEKCLLCSILIDPTVLELLSVWLLSSKNFYSLANRTIFGHIKELNETTNEIDIVSLKQSLEDRGILETVGGMNYLLEIAQAVPSASSASWYADLIHEKYSYAQIPELLEFESSNMRGLHRRLSLLIGAINVVRLTCDNPELEQIMTDILRAGGDPIDDDK